MFSFSKQLRSLHKRIHKKASPTADLQMTIRCRDERLLAET